MEPLFLTLEEILEIHRDQIERYGGALGVRDNGLLESAVAASESGFGSHYLHRDVYEMAAAYLFHLVQNHPFIDGNKRAGAATALVFLVINGVETKMTNRLSSTWCWQWPKGRWTNRLSQNSSARMPDCKSRPICVLSSWRSSVPVATICPRLTSACDKRL